MCASRRTPRVRPAALSSLSSCSSMPAAVTSTSVIASHTRTNHARMALVHQPADLVAERAGVREEERRLPAVHDDARRPRVRSGNVSTLCHPSMPSTRPTTVPCGHQLRRKNMNTERTIASDDALQHAERDHADGRGERQHERGPAHRRVATERAEFNSDSAAAMTTAASADCGRSESSDWNSNEERDDEAGADEPGQLALRARLLGDRGARPAGRHRETLQEPGGEVRGAEADHLLVRVDVVTAPRGERRARSRSCR